MATILKFATTLFVLLILSISAFSQNVADLVAGYRKSLGIAADETQIRTLELRGEFYAEKIRFAGVMYMRQFPEAYRAELRFQEWKFISVSNDSLKWEYNSVKNSHVITPVNKNKGGAGGPDQDTKFDYAHHDLLEYKTRRNDVKLVKKDKLDSMEVFVLDIVTDKREKSRVWLRKKDYLIYKVEDKKGSRYFADYTTVSGIVFPRFVIAASKDQTMEMRFDHLDINKSLHDSLFIIPERAFQGEKQMRDRQDEVFSRGDTHYNNGRYDSATAVYTSIIKKHPENSRGYNSRGLSRLRQENYYGAVADFSAAIDLDPNESVFFNNLGLAKFYLGDHPGAVKEYTKSLQMRPDAPVTLKNRGTAYLQMDSFRLANEDFSRTIKVAPDDREAQYKKGVALASLGKYSEAYELYNLVLKDASFIKPISGEFYNYKGVTEYQLEKFEEARVSFDVARRSDPGNLQYHENLARTLYQMEKYDEASKEFEKYLARNPAAEMYNLNGLCKYFDENYKAAIKEFTKAIAIDGKNANYFDNRASAREMLEDYEGAIQDYSESIRVYPNDPATFYRRGLIKINTSKKLEGCMDLATAHEMKYEDAAAAIREHCP